MGCLWSDRKGHHRVRGVSGCLLENVDLCRNSGPFLEDPRDTFEEGIDPGLLEGRGRIRSRHNALLLCPTSDDGRERNSDRVMSAITYVVDRWPAIW